MLEYNFKFIRFSDKNRVFTKKMYEYNAFYVNLESILWTDSLLNWLIMTTLIIELK